MKQVITIPDEANRTWFADWSKGRIIRLIIFIAIASALLPLFINDRLRGSQKQQVYYINQAAQKTSVLEASSSTAVSDSAKPTITVNLSLTPTAKISIKPAVTLKPRVITPTRVPEFSDSDLQIALNSYRATHQIHNLVREDHLCAYAESRVKDLVELGTLDGHAGFNADFADPLRIPQAIKDYPGGAIGEDLASQYCINMKTNQSFVATTPTALIEWCFDSSTKGHRESLLNDKFNNVCVRHGQNMYVVMLGE